MADDLLRSTAPLLGVVREWTGRMRQAPVPLRPCFEQIAGEDEGTQNPPGDTLPDGLCYGAWFEVGAAPVVLFTSLIDPDEAPNFERCPVAAWIHAYPRTTFEGLLGMVALLAGFGRIERLYTSTHTPEPFLDALLAPTGGCIVLETQLLHVLTQAFGDHTRAREAASALWRSDATLWREAEEIELRPDLSLRRALDERLLLNWRMHEPHYADTVRLWQLLETPSENPVG